MFFIKDWFLLLFYLNRYDIETLNKTLAMNVTPWKLLKGRMSHYFEKKNLVKLINIILADLNTYLSLKLSILESRVGFNWLCIAWNSEDSSLKVLLFSLPFIPKSVPVKYIKILQLYLRFCLLFLQSAKRWMKTIAISSKRPDTQNFTFDYFDVYWKLQYRR